jgi:hypothetical protein
MHQQEIVELFRKDKYGMFEGIWNEYLKEKNIPKESLSMNNLYRLTREGELDRLAEKMIGRAVKMGGMADLIKSLGMMAPKGIEVLTTLLKEGDLKEEELRNGIEILETTQDLFYLWMYSDDIDLLKLLADNNAYPPQVVIDILLWSNVANIEKLRILATKGRFPSSGAIKNIYISRRYTESAKLLAEWNIYPDQDGIDSVWSYGLYVEEIIELLAEKGKYPEKQCVIDYIWKNGSRKITDLLAKGGKYPKHPNSSKDTWAWTNESEWIAVIFLVICWMVFFKKIRFGCRGSQYIRS